jgi:uncharacterized membrane protein
VSALLRAAWLSLAAGLLACGSGAPGPSDGGADGSACARADPSCPNVVPSYANGVRATLEQRCVTCHYPNSPLAESSLATYPAAHLVFGAALGQVSACLMPPATAPQLSSEERAALLSWLACGAPDN